LQGPLNQKGSYLQENFQEIVQIQVCSNHVPCGSDWKTTETIFHVFMLETFFQNLQSQQVNFSQSWYKSFLGEATSSLNIWSDPLQSEDNHKYAKNILFLRTNAPEKEFRFT
jgi:hypothetical protein